jgi:hypothetical protein
VSVKWDLISVKRDLIKLVAKETSARAICLTPAPLDDQRLRIGHGGHGHFPRLGKELTDVEPGLV